MSISHSLAVIAAQTIFSYFLPLDRNFGPGPPLAVHAVACVVTAATCICVQTRTKHTAAIDVIVRSVTGICSGDAASGVSLAVLRSQFGGSGDGSHRAGQRSTPGSGSRHGMRDRIMPSGKKTGFSSIGKVLYRQYKRDPLKKKFPEMI